MPVSQKIVIITQAHPDKDVERYRGFALAKLAKNYPVYVAGPPDYAIVTGYDRNITLAPFLYDPIAQTLDWPRLQNWMQQEKITGAYFMDYDDILCTPPEKTPKAAPGGFFVIQSPQYSERKDNLGMHRVYGATFVGTDIVAKLKLPALTCNHWMRWEIILTALKQGIAPQTVYSDFTQLIFIDQPPYGSRNTHWFQTKAILKLAVQIPNLAKRLGSHGKAFKEISEWLDGFSDITFLSHVSLVELCKQAILPLNSIFSQLLIRSPATPVKPKPVSLKHVKSIGIIKLDNIGDALLMTPMLRQLRQYFKGEIRLLCSRQHYDLWHNCPDIDRLLAVEKVHISDKYTHRFTERGYERDQGCEHERGHDRFGIKRDVVVEYFSSFAEKGQPFLQDCDVILMPRGFADFYGALNLACLTNARYRIMSRNYDGRDAKWNNGFDQNITHIVPRIPSLPHEADSMIELLKQMDIPVKFGPTQLYSWPSAYDLSIVHTMYKPDRRKKQIIVATGATAKSRSWPIEYFIETVRSLKKHLDFEMVLVGVSADAANNRMLALGAGVSTHDLTGRLTLPQTIAMMAKCDLLICNGSAPAHMSSAADIPCIQILAHAKTGHLYHGNAPLRFGAVGKQAVVLQPDDVAGPPCVESCYAGEAHCIKGVTPPMVISDALKLLGLSKRKVA